jgi:hypothetical protein
MSKADDCTIPIRSHRAVLAGIVSAAALPIAAGIPTTAPTADPIFPAIEAYRQADVACVAVDGFRTRWPTDCGTPFQRWSGPAQPHRPVLRLLPVGRASGPIGAP